MARAINTGTAPSEQRKHARFGVETGAKVSVLGSAESVEGQIGDLSQRGMRIHIPLSYPEGEILRVEAGDEVFVTVVCHSTKNDNGGYTLGTEMMHSMKRIHLDALVDEWKIR